MGFSVITTLPNAIDKKFGDTFIRIANSDEYEKFRKLVRADL